MVPHRGTNWAALWLTAQIGRDAVLSESYGRGCQCSGMAGFHKSRTLTLDAHTFSPFRDALREARRNAKVEIDLP